MALSRLPSHRWFAGARRLMIGGSASMLLGAGVFAVLTDTLVIDDSRVDSGDVAVDHLEVAPATFDQSCADPALAWQPASTVAGAQIAHDFGDSLAEPNAAVIHNAVSVCVRSIDDRPLALSVSRANVIETEVGTSPGECEAEQPDATPDCGEVGELGVIMSVSIPNQPVGADAACVDVLGLTGIRDPNPLLGTGNLSAANEFRCRLTVNAWIHALAGISEDDLLRAQSDRVQFDVLLEATPG